MRTCNEAMLLDIRHKMLCSKPLSVTLKQIHLIPESLQHMALK